LLETVYKKQSYKYYLIIPYINICHVTGTVRNGLFLCWCFLWEFYLMLSILTLWWSSRKYFTQKQWLMLRLILGAVPKTHQE